ncbi:MAG: F0F1 ATP synthase subunit A [Candidatus Omnitrophica bacterium]|nr:F0F1 ATP synthase subunit A [Candidatus Omnitrophota bacterium]
MLQNAAQQMTEHAEETSHAAHELPNFITLLYQKFPENPAIHFLHQWENIVFAGLAACLICLVSFLALRQKTKIPSSIQNFVEILVSSIDAFVTGILGEHGRRHIPFLGTIFFYILLMNLSGLIPLMKSPTSAWSTTFAVAMVTMIYIQITGIQEQGIANYLKHMAGSPQNLFGIILIPLMLALNIILEIFAVPFSLSLRLFANISSEDRLIFKFAELNVFFKGLPFLFQIFANLLAIIFSFVQAFVFMLLSTVYLSLVLPHENHEESKTDASQDLKQVVI